MKAEHTPGLLAALMLCACTGAVSPADMKYGEQLCEKHGGLLSVAQFERGRNLVISCRDETGFDVRLKEPRHG